MTRRYFFMLAVSLFALPASIAPAQQQERLYEQVRSSAVEILVDRRLAGCGCIVDPEGLVLTAAHVVKNARRRIEVNSRTTGRVQGTLLAIDAAHDLALLKLPSGVKAANCLRLAKRPPTAGDTIFLYGSPLFRHDVMVRGMAARSQTTFEFVDGEYIEVLHVAGLVTRGFSGGPWVNRRGELVGIQSSAMALGDAHQGLAFATPLEAIRQLLKSRTWTRHPSLGAGIEEIWEQPPAYLEKLPEGMTGLVVRVIHKGGAIAASGIEVGSIVSAIDKQPVERRDELLHALWRHKPGETIELTVSAADGTQQRTVTVRLLRLGPDPGVAIPPSGS
jgi:serine protease Do